MFANSIQIILKNTVIACIFGSSISVIALADDVTDTVEEAMVAYKNGEYKKASEDLSYVLEIINQKKGNDLKAYLPEPLSGWTADETVSQTAGASMFGGGTMLNRAYHKDDASVTIDMVMDSPMIQGVAAMIANPMIRSSDGGELIRINREKAVVKYNAKEHSGEITLIVANRIMITIKGDKVTKEDLMAYGNAIDVKKLKDMP